MIRHLATNFRNKQNYKFPIPEIILNYSMLSSHYIYRTQVTKVNSVPIDELVSDWVINGRLNLFVFETRIKHPNRVVLLAIMWLKGSVL